MARAGLEPELKTQHLLPIVEQSAAPCAGEGDKPNDLDPEQASILELWKNLSENQRAVLLAFAKGLASQGN